MRLYTGQITCGDAPTSQIFFYRDKNMTKINSKEKLRERRIS